MYSQPFPFTCFSVIICINMSDASELLGIIDHNETAANAADDLYRDEIRKLGNYIEAVAHDRFGLANYTAGGEDTEHAAEADEARKSAAINFHKAIGTMDEAINARVLGLRATYKVAQARETLLTSELATDEEPHVD